MGKRKRGKLVKISGVIVAFGTYTVRNDSTRYSYIIIKDSEGHETTIREVSVNGVINSFLNAGENVNIYLMDHKHGYEIFAYENNTRKVFESDIYYEKVKSDYILIFLMTIILLPISIAVIFIAIGILTTPVLLYGIISGYIDASYYKPNRLESFLHENGWPKKP